MRRVTTRGCFAGGGRYDKALEHSKAAALGFREVGGKDNVRATYATYNYAVCLESLGRFKEAAVELEELYDVRTRVLGSTHAATLYTKWRLARVLMQTGRPVDARKLYEELISFIKENGDAKVPLINDPLILNAIAWKLATSAVDEVRDGKLAVEVATMACDLSEYKDYTVVNTLAAAYAEAGDFASAIKWQEKSIELANEKKDIAMSRRFSQRLANYKAGRPYREPIAPNADNESAKKAQLEAEPAAASPIKSD